MNNTVEQGRIHFADFSKVFSLDFHFFDVMTWNIGQLLMFVIPIVFFLLAMKFTKKFVQFVMNGVRSIFSWVRKSIRGGSSNSNFKDDSKFQKSKALKYKEPKSKASDYGWKERVERRRAQRFLGRR